MARRLALRPDLPQTTPIPGVAGSPLTTPLRLRTEDGEPVDLTGVAQASGTQGALALAAEITIAGGTARQFAASVVVQGDDDATNGECRLMMTDLETAVPALYTARIVLTDMSDDDPVVVDKWPGGKAGLLFDFGGDDTDAFTLAQRAIAAAADAEYNRERTLEDREAVEDAADLVESSVQEATDAVNVLSSRALLSILDAEVDTAASLPDPPPEDEGALYLVLDTGIVNQYESGGWTAYSSIYGGDGAAADARLDALEASQATQDTTIATQGETVDALEGQLSSALAGDVYLQYTRYIAENYPTTPPTTAEEQEALRTVIKTAAEDNPGGRVVLRNPNSDGAPYTYETAGLVAFSGIPGFELVIDNNVTVSPAYFTGDNPLAIDEGGEGWQDDDRLSGVFGFLNIDDMRVTMLGGVVDARNEPGHIPLRGRGRVDVAITGTSGTATLRLQKVSTGLVTDYVVTFNTDLATTASDFVTANAASILADFEQTVTADGGTLEFLGASDDGAVASQQASAGLSLDVAAVVYTGIDNPEAGPLQADTLGRSHRAFHFRGCERPVMNGLTGREAWATVFIQDSHDGQVNNTRHLPSLQDGDGPRRDDPANPGEYIGKFNDAGVIFGGTCSGFSIDGWDVDSTTEPVDFNGTSEYPTISGQCITRRCTEGLELSGATDVDGTGMVFIDCITGPSVSAYTGNTATAALRGVRMIYTEDAPTWIQDGEVVAARIQGDCDFEGRVVLKENVDYVDMAAVVMRKDGDVTTRAAGNVILTLTADATASFRGFRDRTPADRVALLDSVYGHRGEAIYFKGAGRLVVRYSGDWRRDDPLVYADSGEVDVQRYENLAEEASGTAYGAVLDAGCAFGRVRWNIDEYAEGMAETLRQRESSIVSALYPAGKLAELATPHARTGCVLAYYNDVMGVYEDTDDITRGLPGGGRYLRTAEGFGSTLTPSGSSPFYPTYDEGRGVVLPPDTIFTVTALQNELEWADHRLTVGFEADALDATAFKSLGRHGGNAPYRMRVRDGRVQVDVSGEGSVVIEPNELTGGTGGSFSALRRYVVSAIFTTVAGSPDTGLLRVRLVDDLANSVETTLALSVPLAADNGVFAIGGSDGGADAGGTLCLVGLFLLDGTDETTSTYYEADETRLFDA